jgi:hypothetical protein
VFKKNSQKYKFQQAISHNDGEFFIWHKQILITTGNEGREIFEYCNRLHIFFLFMPHNAYFIYQQ